MHHLRPLRSSGLRFRSCGKRRPMATVAFGGVAAGRDCASMTGRTWTYAQIQRHGRISARQPKRRTGPCAVKAILSPEARLHSPPGKPFSSHTPLVPIRPENMRPAALCPKPRSSNSLEQGMRNPFEGGPNSVRFPYRRRTYNSATLALATDRRPT